METKTEILELIFSKLQDIEEKLVTHESTFEESLIDNSDFIRLLKITEKTSQIWRAKGRIAYSKVGGKIYYRMSDVEAMLDRDYKKAFHPFKQRMRA